MGWYSKLIEENCEELEFYGQKEKCLNPKISVIVPAYNVEDYIYDCLISILKQTLKDFEIIVINDGSTDRTLSIIKTFMQFDKRIKLIDKKNNGVGSAKNDGLKIAEGECIVFVDSDDVIKNKYFFENIYQKYVTNPVDVVVFGVSNFVNGKYKKSSYGVEKIPQKLKNRVINFSLAEKDLFKIPVLCMSKLYRKNFLQENEIFFQEGCIGEDQIFFIKSLLLAKKLYIMDENFYGYRRARKNSLTSAKKKKDNSVILNFYAIAEFLNDEKFSRKLSNKILTSYLQKCVSWLGKCEKFYRDKYFDELSDLLEFAKWNYPELRTECLKINKNDKYLTLKIKLLKHKLRKYINGKC